MLWRGDQRRRSTSMACTQGEADAAIDLLWKKKQQETA
jgi:hypothetical protein